MQKDIEYLYSLRAYILIMLGIFILSLVLGYLISLKNPGLSENYLESFKESLGWVKSLNPLIIMLFIFLNNALKGLAVVVLGAGLGIILNKILKFIGIWNDILVNNVSKSLLAFVLGLFAIIPVLFIAYNASILGILADNFLRQKGIFFVLAALLPHGIIEVPMILISAGIGLKLGKEMIDLYLKSVQTDMRMELTRGVGFYVRIIAPLLFLAAVVETFVTPLIAFSVMT